MPAQAKKPRKPKYTGEPLSVIGKVIKEWMNQNNRTHNEFARRAGISPSALSNIFSKEHPYPTPDTLNKLAVEMKIDASVLTALLGYAIQPETTPDANAMAIARQIAALPWLAERFTDIMSLSGDELGEFIDHLEYRRHKVETRRRRQQGNAGQPNRSDQ